MGDFFLVVVVRIPALILEIPTLSLTSAQAMNFTGFLWLSTNRPRGTVKVQAMTNYCEKNNQS